MVDARYRRIKTVHPSGPLTLTIFTPEDAEWIEHHIREISVDLHRVQSAIVTIGNSLIVLDREIDQDTLHFSAQSYRPSGTVDESSDDIEVDVLGEYPN
ncbi:hypothetical protein [Alicyclobacillus sp. SO9]|uniref:hypothetical protein n=1 Tax=Alicyclobacillus sp. SO9 TaxID=2665646 RepID=UPI0018E8CBB8|nr:hypothetical protein [Alicyclobacillus sp. SO9]QQE80446.1 hypothetical protein GI364_08545 [Alicyclobacillus sp. SO9]